MQTNGFCARLARLAAVATLLVSMSGYANAATLTQIVVSGGISGTGPGFSFTPADGTISSSRTFNGGLSVGFNGSGHFWSFTFTAINGGALLPGNYPSAQRWPFQSPKRPGLEIDGDGSGCNTLAGLFTIHEATFDPSGNVISLAIDAKQSCGDSLGSTPLAVSIRINSSVPLVMTNPQSIAGLPQEVYEHTLVTLDGSQSYEPASQITAWKWSQISGPAVAIESTSTAVTQFRAPEVAPGGADVVLQLDVADASGQHATSTVPVHVFDRRDRRTWLTWRSPQGDYIGGGKPLSFTPADGNVQIGTVQDVTLGFSGDTFNSWTLDFAGSNSAALAMGNYIDAQRYPFQAPDHPGLSVYGSGRGCNTLSGQFSVLEIDPSESPQRFAARFVQSCETTAPPLRGTVLFNSAAPGTPVARAIGPTHALPGTKVILDATGSSSSGSALVRYGWRQISGTIVATSDPTQPTLRFSMPAIPTTAASVEATTSAELNTSATTPSEPLRFELEVDDEDGLVDVLSLAISIDAVEPPPSPVPAPVLGEWLLLLLGVAFAASASSRLGEVHTGK